MTYIQGQLGGTALGSSTTMSEATVSYDNVTTDATARWAYANALAAANTAGGTSTAYQDAAFRALSYVTYMLEATSGGSAGQVIVGPGISEVWYRAGYTDVLPWFLQCCVINSAWCQA